MKSINIDTIDPIKDFPSMIDKEDDIIIGMDPTILKDMQEYIKMENDPQSRVMRNLFARETLSIAREIKAIYKKLEAPAAGDKLAFRWAERKKRL